MSAKTSPCGSVFSADHITIMPAIRFVMDPYITAIVVIAVVSHGLTFAVSSYNPG